MKRDSSVMWKIISGYRPGRSSGPVFLRPLLIMTVVNWPLLQ